MPKPRAGSSATNTDTLRCPYCGSTRHETYDLGDGLIHLECECGIAFTPDLALVDGEEPRRHVELDL